MFLDLIDPFTVSPMLLAEALVVIIEAIIIFFLMERHAIRAFASSFCANLITGSLSIVYLFFPLEFDFAYTKIGVEAFSLSSSTLILLLLLGLAVNILVEAGVLKLFYRAASTGKIFRVSVAMNIISYVVIVLSFMFPSA